MFLARITALSVGLCVFLSAAYSREVVHLRSGFDLEAISHVLNSSGFSFETPTGNISLAKEDVVGIETVPDPDPVSEAPVSEPAPAMATVASPADLYALIKSAAYREGGTPEFARLVRCVAKVESNFQQDAKSSKGATGLMQLMPGTAKELGVIASQTEDNVRGGARYLKELLLEYHYDSVLALAAYNAGPAAVKKYGGVPPFAETRHYVEKVLREYAKLEMADRVVK